MNPLNYLYAIILGVVLAHWFYRLAIQNMAGPTMDARICVYIGMILCGLMVSLPILTWMATPGAVWTRWWAEIIPTDQLPSRIFFWIETFSLTGVFLTGVMKSDGWSTFCDGGGSDWAWIILFALCVMAVIGFLFGYAFSITLFQNLMRLT